MISSQDPSYVRFVLSDALSDFAEICYIDAPKCPEKHQDATCYNRNRK